MSRMKKSVLWCVGYFDTFYSSCCKVGAFLREAQVITRPLFSLAATYYHFAQSACPVRRSSTLWVGACLHVSTLICFHVGPLPLPFTVPSGFARSSLPRIQPTISTCFISTTTMNHSLLTSAQLLLAHRPV